MPRLVIIPTPIGNLEDITLRALKELASVSLILAEDTRHTRRLLTHYQISARLLSYHQHNKLIRLEATMRALEQGDVALVSNAGMPSIADPGFELVQAAIVAGIEIDVLPGASAVTTAVAGAAIPASGFLFSGFLPRRSKERQERLHNLATVEQALVFFEAPHRVTASLRDMLSVLGERQMAAARELTKVHQEWTRGTIGEVLERYQSVPPKGEITLVVAGARNVDDPDSGAALEFLRDRHLRGDHSRSAIAEASRTFGLSRNDAYRMWLSLGAAGECEEDDSEE